MSAKSFFNLRNLIIVVLGTALTLVFYLRYGNAVKPIIFAGVVLAFSILYPLLFNDKNVMTAGRLKNCGNSSDKLDNIDLTVNRIYKLIKSIKAKSREDVKLTVVEKFMDEIDRFENIIPEIVDDYRRGMDFIRNNSCIQDEIRGIELKISRTKGASRDIYEKTLNEKLLTMQEIEKLKASLEESESRLHYILSILQKIEAIIEASGMDDVLNDDDTSNLNTHLETFSESLKGVLGSMKL